VPLLPLVSDRSCGSWPLRERIPRSFHVQCRSFLRKRLCQWLSLRMMVPINDQQCSPRNFYDFESANAHSTGSRTDYSALRMTPRILAALYLLTCECYRWREHYAAQHRVFYSCNRLKVAISRAHCLSVILQTRSLEIPCTTIDQMQLVNTLCWVKHYAGNLSREQYIVRSTLEFDVDTMNPWEAPRPRVRRSHEQIH